MVPYEITDNGRTAFRESRTMGKLALYVTCKSCGREFDTRLRLDRRSFEKGTLAANYHTCPHCGQKLTYGKADYIAMEG
jgi:DNA-directed RNA polymerase subunit RPC12/RpoP